MLIFPILVFLAVTAAIAALCLLVLPPAAGKRVQQLASTGTSPDWTSRLAHAVMPFAHLSLPKGDWDTSPLRLRLIQAGIRRDDARILFFGLKTALPLLLAGLTFVLLRNLTHVHGTMLLFDVLLAALLGCYLPNLALSLLLRTRKREIFEAFPDAADLMLVCVEAGLGLDAAMTRVANELRLTCTSLAEELHLSNLELRAGGTREQALRNLALRTAVEEVTTFATLLTQADRFGTAIGDALRVFSDDLRLKRRQRAEEMAAKIPTKMLIPLTLFIFPSIIMVIMGPASIVVLRTILPMLRA